MHPRYVVPFIVVIAVGVLLVGRGITGNVVSQTCCFPPNCPVEYTCDAAEPMVESPAQIFNLGIGVILLLAALSYYALLRIKAMLD